jgi:hypothetical protein
MLVYRGRRGEDGSEKVDNVQILASENARKKSLALFYLQKEVTEVCQMLVAPAYNPS